MKRMLLILRRELQELRRNKTFFQTMAILPILMVLIPSGILLYSNNIITEFALEHSPTITGNCAQIGGLRACNKAEILGALLAICFSFFLPIPVILPMMIAAYSVIGEKERKSLEPLLATPVRTPELLLGKSLSAIIPPTLLCWFSFVALVVILRLLLPDSIIASVDIPLWLFTVGLWTPLLAFVTTMVGVSISSRTSDARAAQQYGSLLAVPVVLYVIGIGFGFFEVDQLTTIIGSLILLISCAISFFLALKFFEREAILTKWK